MRKLRGAEKVAARKTQAAHEHSEAHDRVHAASYEARNIDDAIAVLSIAGAGDESTSAMAALAAAAGGGAAGASGLSAAAAAAAADEAHPEKRMKAAFQRYKDRELPLIKAEYPSLRMSQWLEMLKRNWDKSPENPMVAKARAEAMTAKDWKKE
jgi:hypothetical protein